MRSPRMRQRVRIQQKALSANVALTQLLEVRQKLVKNTAFE
jgi:hypothetical protein